MFSHIVTQFISVYNSSILGLMFSLSIKYVYNILQVSVLYLCFIKLLSANHSRVFLVNFAGYLN